MPSIIAAHLLRRLSWHAIAAGVLLALAIQVTFGVLRIALGILPSNGFGHAAGIWSVITAMVSLPAGGWAAARAAGIPSHMDSALHGLFTWAATLLAAQALPDRFAHVVDHYGSEPQAAIWVFLAIIAGAMTASIAGWFAASRDIPLHPRRSS